MRPRWSRRLAARVLLMLTALGLTAEAPAWAQSGDGWSFVITPQVWLSHIAKNGFAAAPDTSSQGGVFVLTNTGDFVTNAFPSESSPKNALNPQWGIQLAAQKGRITLAGAFQYVNFDTSNDITYFHPQNLPFSLIGPNSGERWARELVDTTRMDVDVSASYFFPDVVKNWLDVSAGVGFKFIYASADRSFYNLSAFASFLDNDVSPPGLYTICVSDQCNANNITFKKTVKEKSYLYAATFPMSAIVHLTNDAKWLLPFSVTPLLGAEIRNDENVVYSFDLPQNASQTFVNGVPTFNVKRLDGTTFAYGVTADATVRWIINEMLSAYAGMRVQYINGHDTYLAYGPLLGMSFRFGGK